MVEYGDLGGGTDVGVAHQRAAAARQPGGAEDSLAVLLTFLQRFPAFVCRVDGVPADDPCVNTPPADAYWGLWWSDGESGEWTYSSLAAGSLAVPAGGYVAMVWDGSRATYAPGPARRRIRRPRPPRPRSPRRPRSRVRAPPQR